MGDLPPDRGSSPSLRRSAGGGGGVGRFLVLFCPRVPVGKGHTEARTSKPSYTVRSSQGASAWPGSDSRLALGTHGRLGRYPMALVLAVGTVVVGTRLVLGIHAGVALPCSPRLCYRGFEEPWVQGLLAFNVAFLAALFLVQAWRASRSSGEDDSLADWVFASGGGGPPFLPSR